MCIEAFIFSDFLDGFHRLSDGLLSDSEWEGVVNVNWYIRYRFRKPCHVIGLAFFRLRVNVSTLTQFTRILEHINAFQWDLLWRMVFD